MRESEKSRRERMQRIAARLREAYPDAVCALNFGGEGWRLLVMGRLSAQCTDQRVNLVAKELFEKYPTPEAMAASDPAELEEAVKSCGLYHTKAQNIREACRILVEQYGGEVPREMDELLALPGVGRKIANLLRGDLYHLPAVVTDTHCIRICGRLGFYPETLKDPGKIEKILTELIDPAESSDFCHRIVEFGRDVCTARAPKCGNCFLREECRAYQRK